MTDMEKDYNKVENVQDIDWDSKEEVSEIKWNDPKSNPLYNMHNIWIARNLSDGEFSIFMDKPTLEDDGVWRSICGKWCDLDIRWITIKRGECKHFRLFEELIRQTETY